MGARVEEKLGAETESGAAPAEKNPEAPKVEKKPEPATPAK